MTSTAGIGGADLLRARSVTKHFAGVTALDRVDFDLRAGEVHALVGENGAGKSTLMKILSGVQPADAGEILIDGAPVRFAGVRDAERAGVAIIHQELNLVPELSVAANIFLGREPLRAGLFLDRQAMTAAARRLLARLGIELDPEARVAGLRMGEQQLVEIAKALSLEARILIMDEPTSALSPAECDRLFRIVRGLAAEGVGIVYISHRIDEVIDLAHRVTVLRDGRHVLTAPIAEMTRTRLIAAMVGRDTPPSGPAEPRRPAPAFSPSATSPSTSPAAMAGAASCTASTSTSTRARSSASAAFSAPAARRSSRPSSAPAPAAPPAPSASTAARSKSPLPRAARRLGIALVTEDRKAEGLPSPRSATTWRSPRSGASPASASAAPPGERRWPPTPSAASASRCSGIGQTAATLSGGNQQKA